MSEIMIERGPIPTTEKVGFTVRLDPDIKARLEKLAIAYRISQQGLIDKILAHGLDQLEEQEAAKVKTSKRRVRP